jgi:hypothetical protein
MANSLYNIDTKFIKREDQEVPVVVMGLDIDDLDNLESFITSAAETFRNQRMCSPPSTSSMLVTLIGSCTAEQFKSAWSRCVANDIVLKVFMERMEDATVLHGTRKGELISEASLI